MTYDLIVIGGGPAGTAAAIVAARRGGRVLLLERGRYPRQKVCGEFVSPESLGLLACLLRGSEGEEMLRQAPRISRFRLFSGGAVLEGEIAPAAASVSRFGLDEALWRAAEGAGVECRQQTAADAIEPSANQFRVGAGPESHFARTVLDASGRWSNLQSASVLPVEPWIGVKAHFLGETTALPPAVELYFFVAGYCGVQPVGEGRWNACAMIPAKTLALAGEASLPRKVLALHPELAKRSGAWRQAGETVTTSPLRFQAPQPARAGIPRAGDAAGFIDPFAGDGISLALLGGSMAGEALAEVWAGRTTAEEAARSYARAYEARLLPAFRRAAQLRRLTRAPALLRRPALELARMAGLGGALARATRVGR